MLMLNKMIKLIAVCCIGWSFLTFTAPVAVAVTVPDEFADMYTSQLRSVRLIALNGNDNTPMMLRTRYHMVSLPIVESVKNETLGTLETYFRENQISPELATQLIDALEGGIENDPRCGGRFNECVVIPETFAFSYDYDNQNLYLFVNPQLLNKETPKTQYVDNYNDKTALINHSELNITSYSDRDNDFNLRDKTLLGLPFGHIRSEFNYNSADSTELDRFQLYELAYDIEHQDMRMQLGRFRYGVNFNSTDFLQSNTSFNQTSINIGSSNNLLAGTTNSYQRLYYFSPAAGELRIYRDDRLIMSRNVTEGQGYLTYDQLPTGRYNITMEVVVSGEVVLTETRQIFNNNNQLAVGGIDYLLSFGRFEDSNLSTITGLESNAEQLDNEIFTRGLIAYRPWDSITLGIGTMFSQEQAMGQLGVQAYLPLDSRAGASWAQSSDGGSYWDSYLNMPNLSVQYEEYQQDEQDLLASYLYGETSYKQLSATAIYNFNPVSSAYLIYTNGQQSGSETYDGRLLPSYDYWSITGGYTQTLIYNISLSLMLDYQDFSEDVSMTLTMNMPFDAGKFSVGSQLASTGDRVDQWRNNARYNPRLGKNTSASIEAGQSYYNRDEDRHISDLTLTGNTSNKYFDANAYGYADSTGYAGGSASFSNSQIVTADGIHLTNKKADAYMVVNANSREQDDTAKGFLTLKREGRNQDRNYLYDDTHIYALQKHDSYYARLDTESVALVNTGEEVHRGFAHPGTLMQLNARVSKTVTFISGFTDIFDNEVGDMACEGSGCLDIIEVTPGVYRVSLVAGLPFKLTAGESQCIIPKLDERPELLNFGSNYCLPDIPRGSSVIVQNNGKPIDLYYVGMFAKNSQVEQYVSELKSLGLETLNREIGPANALYVLNYNMQQANNKPPKALQELLELQLAKEDVIMDSLEFPIARL